MLTLAQHVDRILPVGLSGKVSRIVGLAAAVSGFPAPLGAQCLIDRDSELPVLAEVIGFQGGETLVLPYGDLLGVRRGTRVVLTCSCPLARVGERLLGRVVDGLGRFLDGRGPAALPVRTSLQPPRPPALERPRIDRPLITGVRVIDGLLTCGKGQRVGIFSGSGVGKSTLLGQLARASDADVNVVVLVGERGREVREFLERDLGPEGLARSVVVVATGDEPALLRLRAAYYGHAVAEYFRDRGRNVLLMMDSVTRFALAQREIGLAAGEPPATRGYPPSVFALLPRLLERSGRTGRGTITGLYTVLVEGDDTNEPIADTVRGILDGHIVLTRRLAEAAHFPAVDVLASISRLMTDLVTAEHLQAAQSFRQLLAAYRQSEDLIAIGAYQFGSNPAVDAALQLRETMMQFLQQPPGQSTPFADSVQDLVRVQQLRQSLATAPPGATPGAPANRILKAGS